MKTFSLAFILGIFVGALVTSYFSSPDAYRHLLAAKAELLGKETVIDETAPPAPELAEPPTEGPSEPAPDKNAEPQPPLADPAPRHIAPPVEFPEPPLVEIPPAVEPEAPLDPKPAPAPNPEPEPEVVPEEKPKPEPKVAPEPALDPEEETLSEKAQRVMESGAEKAAELAEAAKEKSATLKDDAEPYLDRGVDMGIAASIRAQFKIDRRIDSDALSVEVKNRSVHLLGKVPSSNIKQLVIEIAMGTKGVSQVTEELTVEP